MPDSTIKNSFEWPLAKLTINDAQRLGLVKGVLMREGETKRGETYTRDQIIEGAASLRMAAQTGHAIVSVDHIYNALPEEYQKKYGAPADYLPGGLVLDAQWTEGDDGKMQIEGIMAVEPWLYNVVKDGLAIGNSTESLIRKKENCNADGSGCQYEGHAFVRNSIMLQKTPNGHGTWLEPVSESDIGTILVDNTIQNAVELAPVWNMIKDKMQPVVKNALSDYMTDDDKWKDGEKSIKSYLSEIKDMKDVDKIAAHIAEHPDIMSRHQLEHMTAEDFNSWWTHGPQRIQELEEAAKEKDQKIEALEGENDDDEPAKPQTKAPATETAEDKELENTPRPPEEVKEEPKETEPAKAEEPVKEEVITNEAPSHTEPVSSADTKPDNTQRINEIQFVLNELRPLTTKIPIRAGDTKLFGIMRHIDQRCQTLENELAELLKS